MTSPASSASTAAESVFSSATSKAKTSPAAAAATADAAAQSAKATSFSTVAFISLTGIFTTLAIIAASIYFAGYGDDVAEWWAKRYYKAKAVAEVKVMENTGIESVQGHAKGMTYRLGPCSFFTFLDRNQLGNDIDIVQKWLAD